MAIFGWPGLDPMSGFRQFTRELERWLGRSGEDARRVGGSMYPPLNVLTSQDDVLVQCELAGVDPKDIDLSITGDTLVIRGVKKPPADEEKCGFQRRERGSGDFTRTVVLPDKVDADRVDASMANGILAIRLPKSESAKPKRISIH